MHRVLTSIKRTGTLPGSPEPRGPTPVQLEATSPEIGPVSPVPQLNIALEDGAKLNPNQLIRPFLTGQHSAFSDAVLGGPDSDDDLDEVTQKAFAPSEIRLELTRYALFGRRALAQYGNR